LRLLDTLATIDGDDPRLDPLHEAAVRDTIECFGATGSPVISDGEQRKYHNFWTYCVHGMPNLDAEGFKIPIAAGHTRRMPRLTRGSFRYGRFADRYLEIAQRYAHAPVKQAGILPSALSRLYPETELRGYPRERFIEDLLREHETEVRNCLVEGAHKVQIDFTEGRLAVKLDPSGGLLQSFIDLNNLALSRFSVVRRSAVAGRRPLPSPPSRAPRTAPGPCGWDTRCTCRSRSSHTSCSPPSAAWPAARSAGRRVAAIRRHRLFIGVRPNHGNVCYAPASLAIVSGTSIGMSSSSCAMPLPSGSRRCEAGPPPSSAS
jgi:hypothetical protein